MHTQKTSPVTVMNQAPTSGLSGQSKAIVVQQPQEIPILLQYGGPYATALAGVVAAILAATVALRGIRENRKNIIDQLNLQRELGARSSWANVVSANRQRWIDALREDLAEFISSDFILAENADIDAENYSENNIIQVEKISQAKQRRRLMFQRMQLRINRNKPDQEEFWQAIRAVMPATGSEHRRAVRHLIGLSTALFRKEWLRVKEEASGVTAPLTPNIQLGEAANASDNVTTMPYPGG